VLVLVLLVLLVLLLMTDAMWLLLSMTDEIDSIVVCPVSGFLRGDLISSVSDSVNQMSELSD